mmetsp:Transcript_28223/g.44423  ORF Transcript_28223/g.44423 Transcript_28223/m.44423 type:complete len:208 (+) Transcript_28223:69-692(+)
MLCFLNHRNIIKIHGWGLSNGYFILVDKLQGTLKDRIQRWKKMRWKKVSRLVEQHEVAKAVADVMTFLHERGTLFRDHLKPANIGFNEEGVLKLFDFGMAIKLDSEKILHMDMKMVLYVTSWPRNFAMLLILAMAVVYLLMSTPSASSYGRYTPSRSHLAPRTNRSSSRKCLARESVLQWKIVGHRKSRDCWKRIGQKIRMRGQVFK